MHLTKPARIAAVVVAAAGVAVPATSVAAAKTICVGLVVDAHSLNGPVSADCATVADGSTGYDVLRAAGHTVGFRQDGLICTIDNRPADGCAATDAMHYWAYFHREPHSSSWSYSNEGATTYKPANGETEGWVWRNGDNAIPKPVPYSTICPQQASTSPSPSPSPRTTSATPAHTASSSPTPRRRTHPTRRRHTSTVATPTPVPTRSTATIAAVTSTHDNGSSGPPWALVAGAIAIAALGGTAVVRWRRRAVE